MAHSREGALSAELRVSRTPTTVGSALFRRRTETAVRRSSTWEAVEQICSMSGRNTDLRRDDSVVDDEEWIVLGTLEAADTLMLYCIYSC